MKNEYDVVVIGSGFGGAITAYELAKKGYSVCILERGPQWRGKDFPADSEDFSKDFLKNSLDLAKNAYLSGTGIHTFLGSLSKLFSDLFDLFGTELDLLGANKDGLFYFKKPLSQKMGVLTANGVGGGSLIYENVLHEVHNQRVFEEWPKPPHVGWDWLNQLQSRYLDIKLKIRTTKATLAQSEMMHDKTKALEKAWELNGKRGEYKLVDLAIQPVHHSANKLPPPLDCSSCHELRKETSCHETRIESYCMSCGRCVMGCKRQNKHTLDLNFIKWAVEDHGAHLYPRHEASLIIPLSEGGYKVLCHERSRAFKAKIVVVAAGVLGSTRLLLRCKKGYKDHPATLPDLSEMLGYKFSGNGDFQAFVFDIPESTPISSTIGPGITSEIDLNKADLPIVIEEGGVPKPLAPFLSITAFQKLREKGLGALKELKEDVTGKTLMFLCMGRDGAYGKVELTPDGEDVEIIWEYDGKNHWQTLVDFISNQLEPELKALAQALKGKYHANPVWEIDPEELKRLFTVHPLGGCPMGENVDKGVVDPFGKVFNKKGGYYEGLYVADGSIIPTALGVNPSLTIATLAHMIAEKI